MNINDIKDIKDIKDIREREKIFRILRSELNFTYLLGSKCKTVESITKWVEDNKSKFISLANELEKNGNLNKDEDVLALCKTLKGFAKDGVTEDVIKLAARFARFAVRLVPFSKTVNGHYMNSVRSHLTSELESKNKCIAYAVASVAKNKDAIIKARNEGDIRIPLKEILTSVDALYGDYIWDENECNRKVNASFRKPLEGLGGLISFKASFEELKESFVKILEQWLADMPNDKDFDELKSSLQKLLNKLK